MLNREQFAYLDDALRRKPTIVPRLAPYPLNDGHVPEHRTCQLTAMHLERTQGWSAQIGIQWLDKGGLLLPWPHVVNWVRDELVDFSCPINERKLGFTMIGNDVDMANSLTDDVEGAVLEPPARGWADPLLQELHARWFARLAHYERSGTRRPFNG